MTPPMSNPSPNMDLAGLLDRELLPCPFCGSSDVHPFDNLVICGSCSASGPDLGHTRDRPGAIEAWNRRAPKPSTSTAEAEPVAWPEWASDKHIAEGILEHAEVILQLVIHGQEHLVAEHTGAIKSYAGTLLGREQRRAKYAPAAPSGDGERVTDERVEKAVVQMYRYGMDDGGSRAMMKTAVRAALTAALATPLTEGGERNAVIEECANALNAAEERDGRS